MHMRRGAVDMDKLVLWALGALVLLVILGFMIAQLSPATEGSLTSRVLEALGLS